MKPALLGVANAVFGTSGYAVQMRHILMGLKKREYKVANLGWYGIEGGMIEWNGIPIYPGSGGMFGINVMGGDAKHFGADVILSLQDIWALPHDYRERCLGTPWACLFPVDTTPVAEKNIEIAATADWPIVYSRFGFLEMKGAGLECEYIPHMIDTEVFKPGDKTEARKKLRIPEDAFVVSMVAANKGYPSRKAFPENLRAFKMFLDEHPKAFLRLHTQVDPIDGEGILFNDLLKSLEVPQNRVSFCDQLGVANGLPSWYVALTYQASDVLLNASRAEGFGLPICFLPGTLIATDEGMKPIQSIRLFDRVMTHRGRMKSVLDTMVREVTGENIVSVRLRGLMEPIRSTTEHPYHVVRPSSRKFVSVRRALNRGLSPEWVRASEITNGDFLVIPFVPFSDKSMDELDLGDYARVDGEYLRSKFANHGANGITAKTVAEKAGVSVSRAQEVLGEYNRRDVPASVKEHIESTASDMGWRPVNRLSRYVKLSEDLGFLLGYYIADGSIGGNGQIEFAGNTTTKSNTIRRINRIISELWGLHTYERVRGNKYELTVTCKPLSDAISALCGKGAHNKHIPIDIALQNREFARGLLMGMWYGDGSTGRSDGWTYSTVSYELAMGIRMLMTAFGVLPGIQSDGRGAWVLTVHGRQLDVFARVINKEFHRDTNKRAGQGFIVGDGCFLVPVESVSMESYSGLVYNLEVSEDNSYCAYGVAVHNCEAEACGIPVITTDCSSMPEITVNGICTEPLQPEWFSMGMFGPGSWHFIPSVQRIYQALEDIYAWDDEKRNKESERGVLFIKDNFACDLVIEKYWIPFLDKVGNEIESGEIHIKYEERMARVDAANLIKDRMQKIRDYSPKPYRNRQKPQEAPQKEPR